MAASSAELMAAVPVYQLIGPSGDPYKFFLQGGEENFAQTFKLKFFQRIVILRQFCGKAWQAVQGSQILFAYRVWIKFCDIA
jgi:hypothetical protein